MFHNYLKVILSCKNPIFLFKFKKGTLEKNKYVHLSKLEFYYEKNTLRKKGADGFINYI